MSQAPNWNEWATFLAVVALAATSVVLLVAATTRWFDSAVWQRGFWRAGMCAVLLSLFAQFSGLAQGIVQSFCSKLAEEPVDTTHSFDSPESIAFDGRALTRSIEAWSLAGGYADVGMELIEFEPAGRLADLGPSLGAASSWRERSTWWPGIFWVGGSVVLMVWYAAGRVVVLVCRWRHVAVEDPHLLERVDRLRKCIGLRRVHLVTVPGISSPIAFGLIRPTVGIPAGFAGEYDVTQQEAMLAHELEHLRAWDPIWSMLTDLAAALLWWHPMVWWGRQQWRAVSEWAADEASVVVRNGPEILAGCLIHLGGRLIRSRPLASMGIAGSGFRSSLGRRVARLLSLSDRPLRRPRRAVSAVASFFVAVALLVAAMVSTSWSNTVVIPKGEPMRNTLHRSWKHSVAAVALFSIFGLGETVAAVINPNEPVTAIAEPSFQKEPASDKERTSKSDAAAIKEKLERIEHEIREQKEAGNLDRAEKLAAEGHELRAMLEKIAGSKKVRGKDGEKAESIDQLRERLRQLEAENEKLRHALEDRAAAYAESAKNHYAESVKKHLAEKLLREEEHAKLSEFLKRHADESHALREKLEYLGHLRAKAQDAGRHEEAEKAEKEIHKLTELLEAASKGKAHHEMVGDYARAHAGNQDLLAVMKEMRAEVSRLRDEVAELRKMVTERGEPTPPKKR